MWQFSSNVSGGMGVVGAVVGGAFNLASRISSVFSGEDKEKLLFEACQNGDLAAATELVHSGANVNVNNALDGTPLHKASSGGSAEIVRLLLKAGASTEAEDYHERTPLHKAASAGKAESMRALLQAGAGTQVKDVDKNEHTKDLNPFMKRQRWGQTPLHMAAENGDAECVTLLLEAGADKEAKNDVGFTPLFEAALSGSEQCVRVLLQAGADKDATNAVAPPSRVPTAFRWEEGKTAWHCARLGRHSACEALLTS